MAENPQETDKKRSWKDRLKDMGILEDSPVQSTTPSKSTIQTANTKSSAPTNFTTPSPVITAPISSIGGRMINPEKEEKAFQHFLNLLDKANLPGPDFFEFYNALKENIKALGSSITDEKMLYVMVYNSLKGMGLKPDVLHSSGEQYVALLKEQFDLFNSENQKVIDNVVGARQKKVDSHNLAIQQKQEQIQKLQEEIVAHNTDIQNIHAEIQNETGNIEETRIAFESAFNKINNDFTQVTSKAKMFIQ